MKTTQEKLFTKQKLTFDQVKQEIDSLAADKVIRLGLRLGFISIGVSLIILAVFWKGLPPEVPLLYSRPYGVNQLVSSWWLWLMPGISLIIALVGVRFSGNIMEEDKLLAQIMIWVASVVAVMNLITVIKIVGLVS